MAANIERPENLPTKRQFKSSTFVVGRRQSIRFIDDALQAWHDNDGGFDETAHVYRECRHWVRLKSLKESEGAKRRSAVIIPLVAHCIGWLAYYEPGIGNALGLFESRKAFHAGEYDTRDMPGEYQFERNSWLTSEKSRAISASLVSRALWKNTAVVQHADIPGEFHGLNEEQYVLVDHVMDEAFDVIYLRKLSRLKHMLMLNEHNRFTNIAGEPFSTDLNTGWAYAMDRFGSVFCTDDMNQGGQFNHSSFNAGREVVCAGIIVVNQGALERISNNSGHYQPSAENLENAIAVLEQQGVYLGHCMVYYCSFWEQGHVNVYESTIDVFRNRPKPTDPANQNPIPGSNLAVRRIMD